MKQNITTEQLRELSDKSQEALFKWEKEKGYHIQGDIAFMGDRFKRKEFLATLSIGQMIEFLEEFNPTWDIHPPQKGELNKGDLEHKDDEEYWDSLSMSNPYDWQVEVNSVSSYNTRELCDALWEACKEVLK